MLIKNNSLKSRLILLFILFSCVPLLISSTINNVTLLNTLKDTSVQADLQLNQQIGAAIKRSIDADQGINAAIASMPSVRSMQAAQIVPAIKDFQAKNPQFELIAILDTTGQQIARTSGKPGNRSERDYFKAAMNGQNFATNAYVSSTTKQLCLTVSAPIIGSDGRIIGVVASDITLKSLWDIADSITVGSNGYMDIVDSQGIVIAHPDKARIEQKENFADLPYVKAALNGQSGTTQAVSSKQAESLVSYAPVDGYGWGIITYQPIADIYRAFFSIALFNFLLLVIFLIISIAAALRISNSITTPMREVLEALQRMTAGDLRQKITPHGLQEIHSLGEHFNKMIDSLKNLILKSSETGESVSAASEELSASIDSVVTISTDTKKSMEDSVAKTKEKLSVSLTSINTITNMVKSIDSTVNAANIVSQAAVSSQKIADDGSQKSDIAIKQIMAIQSEVNTTAETVAKLGDKSQQVGKIVDTISGIAEQTNLLSLNAAIEAARAGEHGRGFAVVAEEISKLASQTEDATKEIAAIINEVRNETAQAVTNMQQSRQGVADGVVSVQQTVEAFKAIYAAIENLSLKISEIQQLANEQRAGSQQVQQAVNDISDYLNENADGMNKLNKDSHTQLESLQEIRIAAASLAEMATALQTELNKFTI